MRIQVLFFARSRELAGTSSAVVDVDEGATTGEAMQLIWQQYPALKEIQGRCVLALNQEYVDAAAPQPLKDNDEIAVIPPISGG